MKRRIFFVLAILTGGIALGVLLGFLSDRYDMAFTLFDKMGLLDIPVMFLIFFIGVFLLVNIHEFGHFILGKLMGYDLLMLRVGIFSIQKENGKMRFSIIRNIGYGGLCAMIPKKETSLRNYAIYSAGGILFNMLFGVTILLAVPGLGLRDLFYIPVMATGAISIFFGILNAIPFKSVNQPTDGLVILSILKKTPMAERFYRNSTVSSQIMEGTRPKDLELSDLNRDDPMDLRDNILIFYHYFKEIDEGNLESAGCYLSLLLANLQEVPPFSLPAFYYELIFYSILTGDLEEAKRYYALAGKVLQKDLDINGQRVKAYYEYYVNHDGDEARELALRGLSVREKYPFPGHALMEGDLLEELLRVIGSKERTGG